ncbi:MAG TPA: 50S ribosomal protein L6 [Acidimicrobiia bacterium]|jgi:large subunit ribosomal protein L6|nr:50S ribosomal protein L6 [Acidimicrobiia bacterium]
MSRIGNQPVELPEGVDVQIRGNAVTVKGSKGELSRSFNERIGFDVDDRVITVTRPDDERESRALHGLSRALLYNMVVGVSDGFRKELEIHGVGYRAALKGENIELQVGFSHTVEVKAPEGITFEVPEQTRIVVSGIDKEKVGEVAAGIRKVRPPEPYKGKGIRYSGEYVRRKAGKAGK